ncbi:MAG: fasciclin domain-containing protein [Phototrophicaceae bacterium]
MQRVGLFLTCFAILTLGLIPAQAQSGGSIANIIQQQSDSGLEFTILNQFIESSSLVRRQLRGTGAYTFLAPTDRAFRNLENALNVDLADLLADSDIVTALLNYHTIDARLTATQLRTRDGQVIATELPNAFIGISLGDDNIIVVNNVVEVEAVDIRASNGIIHQINDVLLNRVINELLDERLAATPSPTATMTTAPSATPAPTVTAVNRATANVRFAHFATDAPDIQLTIEDDLSIDRISYKTVTNFSPISQGIYTATITSLDDETPITFDVDLTLLNDDFVTLVLIGSVADETLTILDVTNDLKSLNDDETRLVFLNGLDNSPSVSLTLDDTVLIEGVSYAEIEQDDFDADEGRLTIYETRDDDALLFDIDEQTLNPESLYWIILYGTVNVPEVRIIETHQQSDSDPVISTTPTPTAANNASDERSIIELLDAEDDFSFIIEAVQSVDTEILNRLGNVDADPVTFLAPTDQAFLNLLSTIGYSRTRLLSNANLMSDILQYHMIDDTLTSNDFVAASGTSIVTLLQPSQAFFVRTNDSGRIFLNGTIEFERTNIEASNGMIHIVDDVLLPFAVLDALDL